MLSAVDEMPKLAHSESPASGNGKQPTDTSGATASNSRALPAASLISLYC
jgi:hypothetical protein